jgi:hypothetical protein
MGAESLKPYLQVEKEKTSMTRADTMIVIIELKGDFLCIYQAN